MIKEYLLLGFPLILNSKPQYKKLVFPISKSIRFPFKIQLKYYQKLDFEASP